ncbi:MAG: transcription factor S [Candidatus Nanoarchaeia archaeon]
MMKFCPKCKGLLVPAKEGLLCSSCGYKETETAEIKETVKRKAVTAVKEGEEIPETMPTIAVECPKCKHQEAYFYTQQTRAADEPETQFFICKKCGYRWRKY